MKLIEVNNKKSAQRFLDVPRILYKNDKNWICPLDNDTEGIFDPKTNPYFQHGKAIRWILENDNGQLIGRVAAFINFKKANIFKQPTGGLGFFECIDDEKAAFKLFDACLEWNRANGMEAMDGPINFGENDNFWGLLVEGFMQQSYGMNYNPPYYKRLFEAYGFQSYFEQVTNHLDMTKPFPERFWKIADWFASKPGFTLEHFTFSNAEKYIRDLKKVYDEAWVFHEHFSPLDLEDLRTAIKKAKPIIDEEVIWFAYHEGEPVAFLVMFPDVNQIFRHLNGKLHFWNKLRFLYYVKTKEMKRTRITVMGVTPRFQRYGIESGIFRRLKDVMERRPQYREVELSWVGDFNPKMRALHESVGGFFAKRHITYRKLFNEASEKQTATSIPVNSREINVSEKKIND